MVWTSCLGLITFEHGWVDEGCYLQRTRSSSGDPNSLKWNPLLFPMLFFHYSGESCVCTIWETEPHPPCATLTPQRVLPGCPLPVYTLPCWPAGRKQGSAALGTNLGRTTRDKPGLQGRVGSRNQNSDEHLGESIPQCCPGQEGGIAGTDLTEDSAVVPSL